MSAAGLGKYSSVQLRRLSRRMWQLRHRPRDSHLRSKIGKQTTALLPRAPWLGELPYFEAEAWCEWLDDKIAAEAEDAKRQAIGKWRARLDASEANVTSWIRRREKVCGDLCRPGLRPEEVHKPDRWPRQLMRLRFLCYLQLARDLHGAGVIGVGQLRMLQSGQSVKLLKWDPKIADATPKAAQIRVLGVL